MSIFDNKGPEKAEPFSADPASGEQDKELISGVLDRDQIGQGAASKRAISETRPRAPMGSAPMVEVGDPVTYDPTLEDSYDGVLPGDSQRGLDSSPFDAEAEAGAAEAGAAEAGAAEAVQATTAAGPAPGSVPASLDWSDEPQIGELQDEESSEETDAHIGTTISDRYVIDGVLGEGGMGKVYRAHHKVIGKTVAIKILHAELARDKAAVGRFVREAQAASSVGNPHIIDVADFGETEDGSTYFVMEYLDGPSLTDLIESHEALNADQVCDLTLQLCDGLEAAHRQEIVHRDLKPDNITLVEQGNNKQFCKILDFGIAKVNTSASSTKLTMAGAVFGTPHYMSPEQAAGAAVDHRTDIYSLGVMMYEMTSGQLPFHADNFMGILTQHMYKAPVPIRAMVGAPECSPGLEAVILKCLSKKPDARYQSMADLADDVRRVQQGEVPTAVHDMMARSGGFNVPADYFQAGRTNAPELPTGKRQQMKPAQIAMIAGIIAAVGLVGFVLLKNNQSDAQPAPTAVAPTADQPAKPAAPKAIDVMLAANAPASKAVVDGDEVDLPKLITVTEGSPKTVTVRAKDYASQEVTLDGTEKEVRVTLEYVAKRKPAAKPAPTIIPRPIPRRRQMPRPGPKPGSGEVVDPWAK